MYLIGTFVFEESVFDEKLAIIAVALYSFGGLFFFVSAIFMQKRYFFETPMAKDYTAAQGTSVTV